HGAPTAELQLNDIGRVHLDLATPIMAEPYTRNRVTGAVILIDEKTRDTVAARTLLAAHDAPHPDRREAPRRRRGRHGPRRARGPGSADRAARPGRHLARAGAAAPAALE